MKFALLLILLVSGIAYAVSPCPNLAYCNAMIVVTQYQQTQCDARATQQINQLNASIEAMPSPSPSPNNEP